MQPINCVPEETKDERERRIKFGALKLRHLTAQALVDDRLNSHAVEIGHWFLRSPARSDHLLREALHLLQLRAALEQQQVHAGGLERLHAVEDLLRGADQPG